MKYRYTSAFIQAVAVLEKIGVHEMRIPTKQDCRLLARKIFKQFDVNLKLYQERSILDHLMQSELFINYRVWGPNDLKIEVHFFYEGIKYGNYELNFYPDGKLYRYGGLTDACFILQREFERQNLGN